MKALNIALIVIGSLMLIESLTVLLFPKKIENKIKKTSKKRIKNILIFELILGIVFILGGIFI